MFSENVYKIVLSKPKSGKSEMKRIDIVKNDKLYQASLYGDKKVSHKNMDFNQTRDFVKQNFGDNFKQFNAWDKEFEYESRASKKGKIFSQQKVSKNPPKMPVFSGEGFNRQKNHIIAEGDEVHALVDMGVFTEDFRLMGSKRDKFVQINRFIEIIDDEMRKHISHAKVSIIDIGCGKSYLTFLLHHYFTKIRGLDAEICGIDSDESLIKKCQDTAQKYGYGQLSFYTADIKKLASPPIKSFGSDGTLSIAVSLHACDTATDYALAQSVKWGADLIFAAPCCQHELAKQIMPKNLTIFADYGIIRERFSSMATDLVRAKYLESLGYSVQIIEFAGFLHTEKNLLIRAVKTGKQNASAHTDMQAFCDEFRFSPKILNIKR